MMQTCFPETPEQALARAFAAHVLEWAKDIAVQKKTPIDQTTLAILEKAAYAVSLAVSSGDACLPLDALADEQDSHGLAPLRRALLSSAVVAPSARPCNAPLVLDESGRLYLHRYFNYEQTLARRLANLRKTARPDTVRIRALLEKRFPPDDSKTTNWQKIAVALAFRQPLLVISGGPGTGKTTTVASLLACLLEIEPQNRIMLAAPTGKAAMRMQEAISQHAAGLSGQIMPAKTIHRLLGMSGDGAFVRYHAENPLPLDTLIVDEASMLDLEMAANLFNAVPPHARVILLGDKDQLSAVEAGSVFAELSSDMVFTEACKADLDTLSGTQKVSASLPSGSSAPLENSVVWLTKNYRFSETSGIGKLASDIRHRRIDEALDFLCSGSDDSIRWRDMAVPSVAAGFAESLLDCYKPYFDCIKTGVCDTRQVFTIFNRFRILCAVREGAFGVHAINRLVTAGMAEALSGTKTGNHAVPDWFIGKPVMIRQNDYSLGLFNGDVGITLPVSEKDTRLAVWFIKEDGTFRTVPPSRLRQYETSFAMTVHQSQGSEFDSVALLLPAQASQVLCRELIYTGITRAKKNVTVLADRTILEQSLKKPSVRHSGLRERLLEAL